MPNTLFCATILSKAYKNVLKKDHGAGGGGIKQDSWKCEIYGTFISANAKRIKAKVRRWLRQNRVSTGVLLQEYIPNAGRQERRVEVMVTPNGAHIIHAYE